MQKDIKTAPVTGDLESDKEVDGLALIEEVKHEVKYQDSAEDDDGLNMESVPYQQKYRGLKTVCIFYAFCCVGLVNSTLGSSFVDVEILLNTDTKDLSLAFVFHNFGYITGSLLLGVIYPHLNPEVQFMAASLLMGVSVTVAPFTGLLPGFIIPISLMAIGQAYVDAGSQPYLLTLWTQHPLQRPILQGAHTAYALGACIGPVIMQPFLLPTLLIPPTSKTVNSSSLQIEDNINKSEEQNEPEAFALDRNRTGVAYNLSLINGSSFEEIIEVLSNDGYNLKVKYGFMVMGILCLPAVLLFMINLCLEDHTIVLRKKKDNCEDKEKEEHKNSTQTRGMYIFLVMLFGIFVCYMVVEGVPASFVATYVIKGLRWDKYKGPLMQTVLWAAGFAGRLLAIPESAILSPVQTVAINLCLTTMGCILLLLSTFIPVIPEPVIWIAVILAGLGFSSFWPNMTLWIALHKDIDSVVAAVITVGGSTGCIVGPLLTGYMLQYYSADWFVYILFLGNTSLITLFIVASIFVRKVKLMPEPRSEMGSPNQDKTDALMELEPLKGPV